MAKLQLMIDAVDAADLMQEVRALAGGLSSAASPQVRDADPEPETTGRGRRKAKEKDAPATFQEQVREVVEEAKEAEPDLGLDDDEPVYTVADVKAALGGYVQKMQGSMKAGRDKLSAFKTAEGEPVAQISTLQQKDYAAFIASVS